MSKKLPSTKQKLLHTLAQLDSMSGGVYFLNWKHTLCLADNLPLGQMSYMQVTAYFAYS